MKLADAQARLAIAEVLLRRAAVHIPQYPRISWWREYYLFTGQHMIQTADEVWEDGAMKERYLYDPDYGADYIWDEVNPPPQRKGFSFT